MRVGKIGVIVIGLVPFNVYGECTPTPDCADMGYTETSCSGKFVRCPFDTSKLFCAPCDSKFQYTCSGDNITGGTGSACGGKYVSCECNARYVFNDGNCVCDTSCSVGYIYYSDGTCSACVDSTKTAIGIVVKDNEIVVALVVPEMTWGAYRTDVAGLTNISSVATAQMDYAGKSNTGIIAAAHTSIGETSATSAAIYCRNFSTIGTNMGDWYLPAVGEIRDYIYANYGKVRTGWDLVGTTIPDSYFWSSSEYDSDSIWYVLFNSGVAGPAGKFNASSVSCFLAI